ncbi:MAG: thrombospondin, partial [Deltaproteobacteria bacterium]|nr:thrombospondin [Deltaproteobacteria bacterium]
MIAGLSVLLGTTVAHAQDRTFDVDRWRPSMDGEGLVGVEDTIVPGPWHWNVGFFGTYQLRPLVLESSRGDIDVIEHRVVSTLLFTVGIADRFALGLSAPFVLQQSGDASNVGSGGALPQVATGDAALSFKWRFLGRAWNRDRVGSEGYGLAFLARLAVPTGNDDAFATTGTWSLETGLAADLALPVLIVGASLRARVIGEESVYFDAAFSHAIALSLGASMVLPPLPRVSAFVELHAETQMEDPFDAATTPVEADLGLRWQPPIDFVLSVGGGLGLSDAVGAPAARIMAGVHWAPRDHDRDSDGIADERDLCEALAEDRDGFEDGDGCPDPDDDEDGVEDQEDRCPQDPEDLDDFQDGDGCPEEDNDGDGVADADDRCAGQQEDRDGFEDADGCPDLDDDGDGIPDAQDDCRTEREDADGVADGDGCPDPDDDGDGVPDADDRCPIVPEDRDGTDDTDGCPEDDNDRDSVLDANDRCQGQTEDVDGVEDDDGCPEAGGRALLEIPPTGWLVLRTPLRFGADGRVHPSSSAMVQQLARHLRSAQMALTIWWPRPAAPATAPAAPA